MTAKQTFYVLCTVLLLLFVAIIGGTYAGNALLTKQANKLQHLKLQSQVYGREASEVSQAKADVNKYVSLGNIARSIVPQDKDQAEAVREIVNIASTAGLSPTSITFVASSLGASAAGTVAPTTGPVSASPLSQLTPVKGIPGVYNLQITIQQDDKHSVSYNNFLDFLSRLELNRRTAQVTSIQLKPDKVLTGQLSFTLIVNEFIKP
jgi:hypothetical protein